MELSYNLICYIFILVVLIVPLFYLIYKVNKRVIKFEQQKRQFKEQDARRFYLDEDLDKVYMFSFYGLVGYLKYQMLKHSVPISFALFVLGTYLSFITDHDIVCSYKGVLDCDKSTHVYYYNINYMNIWSNIDYTQLLSIVIMIVVSLSIIIFSLNSLVDFYDKRRVSNESDKNILSVLLFVAYVLKFILLLEINKYILFKGYGLIHTLSYVHPLGLTLGGVVGVIGLHIAYVRNKLFDQRTEDQRLQYEADTFTKQIELATENLGSNLSTVRYSAIKMLVNMSIRSHTTKVHNDEEKHSDKNKYLNLTNHAQVVVDLLCRHAVTLSFYINNKNMTHQKYIDNINILKTKYGLTPTQAIEEIRYTIYSLCSDYTNRELFDDNSNYIFSTLALRKSLKGLIIKDTQFISKLDLTYANLSGAYLSNITTGNLDLRESDLDHFSLIESKIENINLSRLELKNVNLSGVKFSSIEVTGSKFLNVDVTGTELERLGKHDLNHNYVVIDGKRKYLNYNFKDKLLEFQRCCYQRFSIPMNCL